MCLDRFRCYLEGGRPLGGLRSYPGARDHRPASADIPCWLPGEAYYAGASPTWGGGVLFLDPDRDGRTPARGYLVTRAQFDDVLAQESARYERVVECARIDDIVAYTFTAASPAAERDLVPPTAPYLRMLTEGLVETHGWRTRRAVEYLTGLPGARGAWTVDAALRAIKH